jgi:hypothetical protein
MISLVTKKSTTPEFYSNLNLGIPYSVALALVIGFAQLSELIFQTLGSALELRMRTNLRYSIKEAVFNQGIRVKLAAENVYDINPGL